jgi:hypothetical protein
MADGPADNWPADLAAVDAEIEAEIVADDDPPPFRPGQRVYFAARPQHGSLCVDSVTPYPNGRGWRVDAREGNYRVVGPAGGFRACPSGWTEPPQPPSPGEYFDRGPAGQDAAWAAEQAAAHPEFQRRFSLWRTLAARWLDRLGKSQREGDDG